MPFSRSALVGLGVPRAALPFRAWTLLLWLLFFPLRGRRKPVRPWGPRLLALPLAWVCPFLGWCLGAGCWSSGLPSLGWSSLWEPDPSSLVGSVALIYNRDSWRPRDTAQFLLSLCSPCHQLLCPSDSPLRGPGAPRGKQRGRPGPLGRKAWLSRWSSELPCSATSGWRCGLLPVQAGALLAFFLCPLPTWPHRSACTFVGCKALGLRGHLLCVSGSSRHCPLSAGVWSED